MDGQDENYMSSQVEGIYNSNLTHPNTKPSFSLSFQKDMFFQSDRFKLYIFNFSPQLISVEMCIFHWLSPQIMTWISDQIDLTLTGYQVVLISHQNLVWSYMHWMLLHSTHSVPVSWMTAWTQQTFFGASVQSVEMMFL